MRSAIALPGRSVVLTLLAFKANGEVLGAFEDLPHAIVDEFLLFDEFFRLGVLAKLDGFDQDVLELVGETVRGLDLDVRVADAHQVGDQLRGGRGTLVSVVLRMLLKASIFQRAKSPGNSWPNMERAEMILMEVALRSA
jgi:hypothetical protein